MLAPPPLALQLFLPDLVHNPAPRGTAILEHAPALRRLLARARCTRSTSDHFDGLLLTTFGVARSVDWPVAPYTLLADGVDPGTYWWMRADPVHLLLQQNRLVLMDTPHVALSAVESQALLGRLAPHLAAGGFPLLAPRPDRWYLRLPHALELASTPPDAAAGRDVDPLLPCGKDARRLHSLANEIQMLLHDDPVNTAREKQGRLTVNSLWFWGAGRLTAPDARVPRLVWSDDPLARGLALAGGLALAPVPSGLTTWLASASGGLHSIVFDRFAPPADASASERHRMHAERLEHDWFAPLASALAARTVREAEVITFRGGEALRFRALPGDRWKLWRGRVRLPHA